MKNNLLLFTLLRNSTELVNKESFLSSVHTMSIDGSELIDTVNMDDALSGPQWPILKRSTIGLKTDHTPKLQFVKSKGNFYFLGNHLPPTDEFFSSGLAVFFSFTLS